MAEKIRDDEGYVRGTGGGIANQPPGSALTAEILRDEFVWRRWERRQARDNQPITQENLDDAAQSTLQPS